MPICSKMSLCVEKRRSGISWMMSQCHGVNCACFRSAWIVCSVSNTLVRTITKLTNSRTSLRECTLPFGDDLMNVCRSLDPPLNLVDAAKNKPKCLLKYSYIVRVLPVKVKKQELESLKNKEKLVCYTTSTRSNQIDQVSRSIDTLENCVYFLVYLRVF